MAKKSCSFLRPHDRPHYLFPGGTQEPERAWRLHYRGRAPEPSPEITGLIWLDKASALRDEHVTPITIKHVFPFLELYARW